MEGGQHRVHPQPPPQRVVAGEHTRLGVYHDVLRRLRDAGAPEARAPDFADRLWAHFHRFNVRSRYLSATGQTADQVPIGFWRADRARSRLARKAQWTLPIGPWNADCSIGNSSAHVE